jgi:hypothetical protein
MSRHGATVPSATTATLALAAPVVAAYVPRTGCPSSATAPNTQRGGDETWQTQRPT